MCARVSEVSGNAAAAAWFCAAPGWSPRRVHDRVPGPPGIESVRGQALWCVLGGVLLFRVRVGAVPLALGFLASGFGMGPGVSLSL